jgi:hypothetical protein
MDEPTRYIIRMTEEARREIDAEHLRINDASGYRVADEWKTGLIQAIGKLNLFPTGYPAAAESAEVPEGVLVRQMIYRRRKGRSAPAHRVLFSLDDPEEAERRGDPPAVHVLHVRNAAMLSPDSRGNAEGG